MKLRMSVSRLPMSGYINIDPVPRVEPDKQSQFDIRPIDFRNLDVVAFNAECTEVFVDGAIDYLKKANLESFLKTCVDKLRKGGIIHVTGTDVSVVNRMYFNGEISEEQLNTLLYGGDGNNPWSYKSGSHSLQNVKKILESFNLKITTLKYDGVYLHVSARRS